MHVSPFSFVWHIRSFGYNDPRSIQEAEESQP